MRLDEKDTKALTATVLLTILLLVFAFIGGLAVSVFTFAANLARGGC